MENIVVHLLQAKLRAQRTDTIIEEQTQDKILSATSITKRLRHQQ